MRAKIIQYNSTAGTGVASAEGTQYDFTIRHWRSDSAPAAGQTIDISLENRAVSAIFTVSADILAREKASRFANQVGAQFSAAGAEGGLAKGLVDYLSMPVLAAYAMFVLSVTAFNAVSVKFFGVKQGVTLWNIPELAGQFGSGGIRFLLILGFASIIVPVVWRDRRAWFALLLPAAPLLKLGYEAMSAISESKAQMKGMGAFGDAMGNAISDAISIDLGGYGAGIAAVVLAVFALKRAFASTGNIDLSAMVTNSSASACAEPIHAAPTAPAAQAVRAAASICKTCETPFDAGSVFCGNCGQKL